MSAKHTDKEKIHPKSAIQKLEELPEYTRKTIFKVSLIILMLAVISFWLWSLKLSLKPDVNQVSDSNDNLQQIQQDLNLLIDTTKTGIQAIKNQIDRLDQEIKQPELSDEEIELLKEKLLGKKSN